MARRRRLIVEIVVAAAAVACFVAGYHFGGELHGASGQTASQDRLHRILAYALAGGWLLLATYSVRQLANHLGRAIALADTATAASVRLILTIVGLLVVLLLGLAILRIGVSQILLGGAITGVVLGIAAQQSLGNVFAGIVLLVARPFRAGDLVRVRTGALGGPFEGHVVSMGLIYVVFTTDEGTSLVPNLTLLAAGIVRSPRPLPAPVPLVVVGTPVEPAITASAETPAPQATATATTATGAGAIGSSDPASSSERP
ncbi:MAG: mechanosensitive ion channel domain-containing protein [Acidimicrobiales bacterium]